MNADVRRRRRLRRAIAEHQERLDALDPSRYMREMDYRRLVTFYRNRIRGLERLLETESREEGSPLVCL